uniref:T cell receptor beta chain MC.7.G5-like n=1 Tax=Euleptes europaea TaxID=460621 RepID=UPI002540DBED|nr:T cell receptor beta chain MC.7.G5-like [Euleptes europaea]
MEAMWWEMLLGISVVLQLLAGLCRGVTVTQKERFMILQAGAKARIPCEHDDDTYFTISWYRQKSNSAGREMQLVGYSADTNSSVTEKDKTQFAIERPSLREASLTVAAAQTADTAGYFCAARSQAETVYFGQGTRLTVLEPGQEPRPPNVTIFAPSKEEIKEKHAVTLVCLAYNFIPDHVNIRWYKSDTEITEGVKTEEFCKYDSVTKSYSLTSRLRLSEYEWENSLNPFRCKVKFYNNDGGTDYESEIRREGCDTAKASYENSSYVGRFVYILLILKSTLYGAFVMGLMLRKKRVQ